MKLLSLQAHPVEQKLPPATTFRSGMLLTLLGFGVYQLCSLGRLLSLFEQLRQYLPHGIPMGGVLVRLFAQCLTHSKC